MNKKRILTIKPSGEAKNQNMIGLIRKVHGMIDNPDIEKHRQSQDHVGALLGSSKEFQMREVKIQDMEGEWVSVNRAHMKKYVILYCHGGGYSTGSSIYARTLTTKLAASTSMDVLCFDYRLAPEHPYPAATEDAMKAWNYLMLLGYGARDVIVAGDSAGGNLALSLVLKLKEERRLLPRGLVLLSPWTDLTSSGESYLENAELDPILDAAYLEKMIFNYTVGNPETDKSQEDQKQPGTVQSEQALSGRPAQDRPSADQPAQDQPSADQPAQDQSPADQFEEEQHLTGQTREEKEEEQMRASEKSLNLKDPFISPLFGDFTGFPPTYIQAGENEILLSDSTRLHRKLIEENVSVKLDIFKGMWHVFQMSPFKTAYEAMEKNAEFIYDICR